MPPPLKNKKTHLWLSTSKWAHSNVLLGSPAIPEGPEALRPRLATGLPFSRTNNTFKRTF
jgi:hypothetical protein